MVETMILVVLLLILAILALMHFKPPKIPGVLGAMSIFQPKDDVTTVLPLPIQAATCTHDWDVVTEQTLELPHEKKYIAILQCHRCGMVDKTVQTTSRPPAPPAKDWTKAECRHKWDIEKRVVLDSAYEQMLKSIGTKQPYGKSKVEGDKRIDLDLDIAPPWMFRKSYIVVRVCQTCGEIDKTIASNFELEDAAAEGDTPPESIKVGKKKM